jgi:hypothetical protein
MVLSHDILFSVGFLVLFLYCVYEWGVRSMGLVVPGEAHGGLFFGRVLFSG